MSELNLMNVVEELEAAAKRLQESLLSRDAERIFHDLGQQEKTLEKLNACCNLASGLVDLVQNNPTLRQMLLRCQAIVQANRSLARRFLDVIDQTFSRLGRVNTVAYAGGYGNTMQTSSPILVRQQG